MNLIGEAKPFDLWHAVPPALRAVMPNVGWSRVRLHALELPVVELSIDDLAWQLDLPFWRNDEQYFSLRPIEVARAPDRFPRHWQRTQAADLSFPIDLLDSTPPFVLDGVHRLLKAYVQGERVIRAHAVDPELFEKQLVER